jgi:hypothetical protein
MTPQCFSGASADDKIAIQQLAEIEMSRRVGDSSKSRTMSYGAGLCALCVAAGLLIVAGQAFAGKTKPVLSTSDKLMMCDAKAVGCKSDCDKLIDVDTNVRDCKNRCEVAAARCRVRVSRPQ